MQIIILLGIATLISLLVTITFGILMKKGKPVFKYHKFFAYLTLVLSLIHACLVIF